MIKPIPGGESIERQAIHDKTDPWRREYIEEYIFYHLLISEIDTDI